ncbi:glycosyltransferase family 2 protein [Maribacter hydrothermalis]|uniref:Glycosyltransferase 2-like domain-containing protein n=1 Tax=Maribacter hydrothermalis TaxID=1836467 RepID=A0A1B7ZBW1_9FLAO|nr:glycosyltransferase [Maribacter hydrothermalis]APQ15972.1 hypothetical protein BTR34_00835 [Maribacter hydrothermalis]OBR40389.1 hypothetical protein A9200_16040 [Maribacter hydrothermalis]
MSKITIIIPCFNEEQSIKQTLLKIVAEISKFTNHTFHIIVVDDYSTDNSLAILNEFRNTVCNELQIITNKTNLGIALSTKVLLEDALKHSPDFVLKCDMDNDFPHEQVFKTFLNYINENNTNYNYILVGERQIEDDNSMSLLEFNEKLKMESYLSNTLNIKNYNPVSSGVLLYGKNVLKTILQEQIVQEYSLRWGLDFLLPLVAIKLNYKVVKSKMNNGIYSKERRPESKIKAQYAAYYHILKLVNNTYPL